VRREKRSLKSVSGKKKGTKNDLKDFAMTVERDEKPQHIEVRFVDHA
jgi:hypothetical protein